MTDESDSGAPRIFDLEHAKIIGVDEISRGLFGDIRYKSPEIVGFKPYNHKADVWAFGVILFLMASGGQFPFDSNMRANFDTIYDDIESKILNEQPKWEAIENCSNPLKDLLKIILDKKTRPNISVVMKHRWFTDQTPIA